MKSSLPDITLNTRYTSHKVASCGVATEYRNSACLLSCRVSDRGNIHILVTMQIPCLSRLAPNCGIIAGFITKAV